MAEVRKTLNQLATEIANAEHRYVCAKIRHVKTDGLYTIVGAHIRENDMALCLEYSPVANPDVIFARSIEEMDFGNRFVFVGGPIGARTQPGGQE